MVGKQSVRGSTRSGSVEVDETFVRTVWPGLVQLGRLLTGSVEQGEDIAQEALLGLVRRKSVNAPVAYLRRSVVNLSINVARRKRVEQRYLATQRLDDSVLAPDEHLMWSTLDDLPSRQRAVIVLRYYLDLSEKEIAAALGCRPGTVKSLAARALSKLRNSIEESAQ